MLNQRAKFYGESFEKSPKPRIARIQVFDVLKASDIDQDPTRY
jgi:hypothetical protein